MNITQKAFECASCWGSNATRKLRDQIFILFSIGLCMDDRQIFRPDFFDRFPQFVSAERQAAEAHPEFNKHFDIPIKLVGADQERM